MSHVTRILSQTESGDPSAAEKLLPLVYQELRQLAAAKLSQERPGQTLQPTVLVHEAYLRLVDVAQPQQWNGRGHFFAAAAEAMFWPHWKSNRRSSGRRFLRKLAAATCRSAARSSSFCVPSRRPFAVDDVLGRNGTALATAHG